MLCVLAESVSSAHSFVLAPSKLLCSPCTSRLRQTDHVRPPPPRIRGNLSTSDWGQHHDEAKQNECLMFRIPALDTHVVEQHDGPSTRAEVLAVDQLQRGRGDRREHHVAQQKRDVRDADTKELQRLAPFSPTEPFDSSNQKRQDRQDTNERRPAQVRRDDVVVVVVVGADAAHGQVDVERKHGQCRDQLDG